MAVAIYFKFYRLQHPCTRRTPKHDLKSKKLFQGSLPTEFIFSYRAAWFSEQQENHSTNYCTAYGGKNEGKWFPSWSTKYKEKLQLQLNTKIKEHGPSKSATVQTNTSSVEQQAMELSSERKKQLTEQLITQTETELKQHQQHKNEGYVEQNHTEVEDQWNMDEY